jgi:hypothetical protein
MDKIKKALTKNKNPLKKYKMPPKKTTPPYPLKNTKKGAGVICEPWFTGSPEICELKKNLNHKKIPNSR